MRPGIVLLSVLCLMGCEPGPTEEDGGVDAGQQVPLTRVRVATFNVKLFFDSTCQSGACAAADFEQVLTPQAFDARAAEIAGAIRGFDADVVALQELETQGCLDALISRLGDALPYGVLGEINTAGSVDVAILSKTPLENVVGHRNLERLTRPDGSRTNYSREFLEAHVRVADGTEVVLFAAHFRSKSMDDPGRRFAEAQTSRRIVTDVATALPGALVVMAGDLNDFPGSAPIEALTADGGLLRVAADLPVADQYTYVFNGRGEAIDHILQGPTPAAVPVPRSAIVWKHSRGFAGSDHYALTADFEIARPAP
ncbi:MAG: endonuclease/exonuclease/phosphatase family protein [Archangium sp.]|nr:endonuclease/exonuclease/phosphatase family protein [Archangium sp.]MDP3156932.1 endonuclease/exonuclease/phosphatase family protein [Archangium sp.]MDP3575612.1 endonuclease/exonuclease/phosphatase family protein [Archangium sp.]